MAKSIFLFVFTVAHAVVGAGCLIVSFLSVFNMCGPGHPATLFTYVTGIAGLVLLFPFGLLSGPLSFFVAVWILPIPPFVIIGAGILLNSYWWGRCLWNRGARMHSMK